MVVGAHRGSRRQSARAGDLHERGLSRVTPGRGGGARSIVRAGVERVGTGSAGPHRGDPFQPQGVGRSQ